MRAVEIHVTHFLTPCFLHIDGPRATRFAADRILRCQPGRYSVPAIENASPACRWSDRLTLDLFLLGRFICMPQYKKKKNPAA